MTTNMAKKNVDSEFEDNKLMDYEEVADLLKLKVGDHLRVTSNVYQQAGVRKCSYIILKEKLDQGDGTIAWVVNSYKEQYADWRVCFSNPYKQYRAYQKVAKPFTGNCDKCKLTVQAPYTRCYICKHPQ